jgi:hypothetical protein
LQQKLEKLLSLIVTGFLFGLSTYDNSRTTKLILINCNVVKFYKHLYIYVHIFNSSVTAIQCTLHQGQRTCLDRSRPVSVDIYRNKNISNTELQGEHTNLQLLTESRISHALIADISFMLLPSRSEWAIFPAFRECIMRLSSSVTEITVLASGNLGDESS